MGLVTGWAPVRFEMQKKCEMKASRGLRVCMSITWVGCEIRGCEGWGRKEAEAEKDVIGWGGLRWDRIGRSCSYRPCGRTDSSTGQQQPRVTADGRRQLPLGPID